MSFSITKAQSGFLPVWKIFTFYLPNMNSKKKTKKLSTCGHLVKSNKGLGFTGVAGEAQCCFVVVVHNSSH